MNDTKHAYTVQEAADALGLSRSTVQKLLHTTDPVDFLPSALMGSKRLIRPAHIEAWLDRHMED
ncbi:helix-turn-helix domain-containing protein [Brachybacterium sp. FME24]|uniref:helix-turn-helix domain-containing protein n=1 Tax=Brachybacterium sp. FME24 TaxID=2742605 RepID=UPI0018683D3C|nr:helix-turn-helix domain-containing protein [Brachybacterium sp. FME24]